MKDCKFITSAIFMRLDRVSCYRYSSKYFVYSIYVKTYNNLKNGYYSPQLANMEIKV